MTEEGSDNHDRSGCHPRGSPKPLRGGRFPRLTGAGRRGSRAGGLLLRRAHAGPTPSAALVSDLAFGSGLYDADADAAAGASRDALAASLGCGVPTAVADLHAGETVLDLGSGAGADVLISARRVWPAGRVIGLDMTTEMLEAARRNAAACHARR